MLEIFFKDVSQGFAHHILMCYAHFALFVSSLLNWLRFVIQALKDNILESQKIEILRTIF